MALFAEAKVLTKEGRDSAALQVLENLMSEYPKQLSLSNFREILGETQMLRGLLLANADRWQEAGPYLESASPPTAMESVFCYYLGQYYYTIRDYGRSAQHLSKSLTPDMPPRWKCRAHYMLGLCEYKRANMKAAKQQFELSVQTADREYIRKNNIWGWLEATSRHLGLQSEAEEYRRKATATP
jgi:tetratricopeptide (TPR) repeat protein